MRNNNNNSGVHYQLGDRKYSQGLQGLSLNTLHRIGIKSRLVDLPFLHTLFRDNGKVIREHMFLCMHRSSFRELDLGNGLVLVKSDLGVGFTYRFSRMLKPDERDSSLAFSFTQDVWVDKWGELSDRFVFRYRYWTEGSYEHVVVYVDDLWMFACSHDRVYRMLVSSLIDKEVLFRRSLGQIEFSLTGLGANFRDINLESVLRKHKLLYRERGVGAVYLVFDLSKIEL